MLILKGLILLSLGAIIYQDIKSREVYWFLLPVLMLLFGYQHYQNVLSIHFINAVLVNIAIITLVLSVLYVYTFLKIKKSFFKEVFGPADALFFFALAVAFPTVTFVIIFVFSLLFSLITWIVLKHKSNYNTIPLAGYMSCFVLFIFAANWLTRSINLFLI